MKKVYKMKELDCANCAAKMERGISLIDGVKACNVNFIMQKLTLEIDDGADLSAVLAAVKAAVKRVDSDSEIIGL